MPSSLRSRPTRWRMVGSGVPWISMANLTHTQMMNVAKTSTIPQLTIKSIFIDINRRFLVTIPSHGWCMIVLPTSKSMTPFPRLRHLLVMAHPFMAVPVFQWNPHGQDTDVFKQMDKETKKQARRPPLVGHSRSVGQWVLIASSVIHKWESMDWIEGKFTGKPHI